MEPPSSPPPALHHLVSRITAAKEVLEEYLLGGDHEWESEHRITVGSENGTGYKLGDRADGKKNINTCTQAELEAVNLVGPTRAASIIAGRPYYGVDDAALFDILEANMDIGTTIAGYVGASFYAPPQPGHLLVGLRFGGIDVPQGARVVSAYVALRVEEVDDDSCALTVAMEASDDALVFPAFDTQFGSSLYDLAKRPRTAAAARWVVPPTTGRVDESFASPDLSAVLQEVVDRPGWAVGGHINLLINGSDPTTSATADGNGRRVFDGVLRQAPALYVAWAPTTDELLAYSTERARRPDGTPFPISENLPDHLRRVVHARLSDVHDALEENIGTFMEHTYVNDTGLP